MATFLSLVNSVLRRLRETEVSNWDDNDYSILIGDFVNQAKREVEDAWTWTRLRTYKEITTVASTYEYVITDAGKRFRLLVDPSTNREDVFNLTSDHRLQRAPSVSWLNRQLEFGTSQESDPLYFAFSGYDSSNPKVKLWPIPGSEQIIRFHMYIPQDNFTLDEDELVVPTDPVILRAYSLAVSERGEDQGAVVNEVDRQFVEALGNEIAFDSGLVSEEIIWRVE